jgi:hypothetical protein
MIKKAAWTLGSKFLQIGIRTEIINNLAISGIERAVL